VSVREVIDQIIDVSNYLQRNPNKMGLTKKFSQAHPFVIDGLRLIENNLSAADMLEILQTDLENRRDEQMQQVEILKTLGKYPPAFGMMGTVVGLIGLLGTLGANENAIIGPSMAVALLTTLYGLLLSNYFFTPVSDNLLHRLADDYVARQTMIKGLMLVQEGKDPVVVREFLRVYVPPVERSSIALAGA
jgi:chemotaxis protein MotA